MPGGSPHSGPYQLTESHRSLGVQPLGAPRDALEMLADLGQQMFDVTPACRLIDLHSKAPYRAPMAALIPRSLLDRAPDRSSDPPYEGGVPRLPQQHNNLPCWRGAMRASAVHHITRLTQLPAGFLGEQVERAPDQSLYKRSNAVLGRDRELGVHLSQPQGEGLRWGWAFWSLDQNKVSASSSEVEMTT